MSVSSSEFNNEFSLEECVTMIESIDGWNRVPRSPSISNQGMPNFETYKGKIDYDNQFNSDHKKEHRTNVDVYVSWIYQRQGVEIKVVMQTPEGHVDLAQYQREECTGISDPYMQAMIHVEAHAMHEYDKFSFLKERKVEVVETLKNYITDLQKGKKN